MGRAEDTGSGGGGDGAIYDHPGNVDSKVGVDIGWAIPIRLRTTLGEGQINLGHVKAGENL